MCQAAFLHLLVNWYCVASVTACKWPSYDMSCSLLDAKVRRLTDATGWMATDTAIARLLQLLAGQLTEGERIEALTSGYFGF